MSAPPDAFHPKRRRAAATWIAAATALALLALQASCGASVTPTPRSPGASVSPSSLTFDAQGVGTTSSAKTVMLSSTGSAPLAITGISASGDFAQTNNCGSSLASGANCAINVTFKPTASGTRTGTLTVTSNASTRTTTLSGTGLAGTAAGTYPISVTGTAGTLVNSGTVTLVVQ